jgi:hypothetical protein
MNPVMSQVDMVPDDDLNTRLKFYASSLFAFLLLILFFNLITFFRLMVGNILFSLYTVVILLYRILRIKTYLFQFYIRTCNVSSSKSFEK